MYVTISRPISTSVFVFFFLNFGMFLSESKKPPANSEKHLNIPFKKKILTNQYENNNNHKERMLDAQFNKYVFHIEKKG